MESNDSPEIPDRGETSDIPGLPSGAHRCNTTHTQTLHNTTHTYIQTKQITSHAHTHLNYFGLVTVWFFLVLELFRFRFLLVLELISNQFRAPRVQEDVTVHVWKRLSPQTSCWPAVLHDQFLHTMWWNWWWWWWLYTCRALNIHVQAILKASYVEQEKQ